MAKKKGPKTVPLTPGGKISNFQELTRLIPIHVYPYTPLISPILASDALEFWQVLIYTNSLTNDLHIKKRGKKLSFLNRIIDINCHF